MEHNLNSNSGFFQIILEWREKERSHLGKTVWVQTQVHRVTHTITHLQMCDCVSHKHIPIFEGVQSHFKSNKTSGKTLETNNSQSWDEQVEKVADSNLSIHVNRYFSPAVCSDISLVPTLLPAHLSEDFSWTSSARSIVCNSLKIEQRDFN
ncbi:hypothetical protein HELRODRAFT_167667 [Helobdella robusta]|uniref:Uncharacterized protein n=1 Tax=Helobdella robusta TaxID=6412 RepID=T1EZM9_HELRO|nr:hypothetical protein HELRODRAFT_167667 [Helobdella robusta]ESO09848.1 hypothetical protein HELRODRAFT_167667 [Helobdella robusta]